MSRVLSVQQFRGADGYARISEQWRTLMQSVPDQCFYHHPAWFGSWFARPGDHGDISFRCVFDGSQLIAVCPLQTRGRHAKVFRKAALPSHDSLYMPDIAVAESADLSAVWNCLSVPGPDSGAQQWDFFHAPSVLEDSAIARILRASRSDIVVESHVSRCAIVDVIAYDEAMKALKKKFRGNLNNAKNRLARQHDVVFRCVTESGETESAFDEFVALEMSGWKGDLSRKRENYPQPAAIGLNQSKYAFYRNVVKEFSETNSIEINLLEVDGKMIGSQICLILNDCSYLLKTAFDEDSRGYSPGHVLLDYAYRRYADSGKIEKMCLITDYDWFSNWNPRYLNYLDLKTFRKSLRGRVASAAYSALRKN